jgi:hypothetical protein
MSQKYAVSNIHTHIHTNQMSDWERRPLSAEQLQYAALDAHVLISIVDAKQHTLPWSTSVHEMVDMHTERARKEGLKKSRGGSEEGGARRNRKNARGDAVDAAAGEAEEDSVSVDVTSVGRTPALGRGSLGGDSAMQMDACGTDGFPLPGVRAAGGGDAMCKLKSGTDLGETRATTAECSGDDAGAAQARGPEYVCEWLRQRGVDVSLARAAGEGPCVSAKDAAEAFGVPVDKVGA